MLRFLPALAVVAVTAAACGGGQITEDSFDTVPPSSTSSSTSEVPQVSDVPGTTGPTTTAATTAPVVVEGPPAPDFSLALADGTEFTLSAEQKPVYMVFWAEW
ncbi:MAG: hypothetical protein IH850_02720 [Acidobacteria bacterium]|nr:hypothetical protein [Acidobacteriota bacterium]